MLRAALLLGALPGVALGSFALLDPKDYSRHFAALPEVGGITGAAAASWAEAMLPFVDLPASEPDLLAAYYYRV